jgi:allophanate hydrolase subunit 2
MDCYRLAQARPGTTVAFKEIGLEEAVRVTLELMGFVAIS